MGFLQALVAIIIIAMIIITAIDQPRLSLEYGKAFVSSGKVIWGWCVNMTKTIFNEFRHTENNSNKEGE